MRIESQIIVSTIHRASRRTLVRPTAWTGARASDGTQFQCYTRVREPSANGTTKRAKRGQAGRAVGEFIKFHDSELKVLMILFCINQKS